jgi:phage baseplate assembly protein W
MTLPALPADAARVDVDVPFRFDDSGRTAAPPDLAGHVRDMIEMLLFTSPGERLNRPDFGTGLLQMVFAPAAPEVAATIEYLTHGAVTRWLSGLVEVHELRVTIIGSALQVDLEYSVSATGQRRRDTFRREVVR